MAASSQRIPSCTGHDGLSSSYKQGNNTILGSSPTLSNSLLGSSPSTAAFLKGTGAKKWFDRLKYDSTLDPSEFTVRWRVEALPMACRHYHKYTATMLHSMDMHLELKTLLRTLVKHSLSPALHRLGTWRLSSKPNARAE